MGTSKTLALVTMSALTVASLSACSIGGRSDFINLLEDRANNSTTAVLTFQEVFGSKWSKAAMVCPNEDAQDVHARLGVDSSPMGNRQMAESDNMIFLKSEDGATSWVQFPRKSVDFCQSSAIEERQTLHSAATPMTFDRTEDGTWVMR